MTAADGSTGSESAVAPGAADASRVAKPASHPASPWGRFTLVGDGSEGFSGGAVAVDGDVVVIGAPGFKRDGAPFGAAYVYERTGGAWRQTQRIDAPRRNAREFVNPPTTNARDFAARVGVSKGRVLVFGGLAAERDVSVFRSYGRDEKGRWQLEQEVPLPAGEPLTDAAFEGTTAVVGTMYGAAVYELSEGTWKASQTIRLPRAGRPFVFWVSLRGDTLAVGTHAGSLAATHVYERREGVFESTAVVEHAEGSDPPSGALARGGAAMVVTAGQGWDLCIEERPDGAWTRAAFIRRLKEAGRDGFMSWSRSRVLDADGDLAFAAGRNTPGFVVFQCREDGWYVTRIPPPPEPDPAPGGVFWPTWHPVVALRGRTAVVSTGWDGARSGRAWFFDITDYDLARATKIEPDPPK